MEFGGALASTPSRAGAGGARGHRSPKQEDRPPNRSNYLDALSQMSDDSFEGDARIVRMMPPARETAPMEGPKTGMSSDSGDCKGFQLLLCCHGSILVL